MIRKILVVTAAIAMPVAALSAVTAVAGSGVAGAKGSPPGPITCTQTGSVTFAKPGLSSPGTLTKKTSEISKTVVTGSGTGCSTKAVKEKITTATTPCAGATSPPSICSTGNTAKDPNYYDDATGFVSGGTSSILNSLAGGIKTTDNGTKVTLEVTAASSILPGGTCGASAVGFQLSGGVNDAGGPTGLTYVDRVCFAGDTGKNTTNNFYNDLVSAVGGGTDVIASAGIGGASTLTVS